METVVQILEAEQLIPVMYIPLEMRHNRLEVTLRPVGEAAVEGSQTVHANQKIMQKFLKAAESGEAREHLKKRLAEGAKFDFDTEKLIGGTMNEDDWQNLYTLQKQAWPQTTVKKADG